jgi:hypothetical protein
VIYLVEKEGVNLQEDTTFNKSYSNLAVRDKGVIKSEKFLAQHYIYIYKMEGRNLKSIDSV